MNNKDILDKIDMFHRTDWNKNHFGTTAQAAGMWYCMAMGGGNPPANTIFGTGTNLAFQALKDTTSGAAGIQHGGNAGRKDDFKRILRASAFSAAATTAPFSLMLVDMLGFYNITSVTTATAQALDNTVTIPRYTSGKGVQAFMTPSTVMGAATPTLALNKYTNSAGTANKGTPTALPIGLTAAPVTSIPYSGTGAGKYGPFMPLAAGDQGIRSVQEITLSESYVSAVLNLVLAKPLLNINVGALGVEGRLDFVDDLASMPKVYDEACLAWLMYAGANTPVNSALFGSLEFGW